MNTTEKLIAIWAAFMLPFIVKVPVVDFTIFGLSFSFTTLALLCTFCVVKVDDAIGNVRLSSVLFILYIFAILVVSTTYGISKDHYADFAMMAKFVILNLMIYLLSISINSRASIDFSFRLYYLICCFAAPIAS